MRQENELLSAKTLFSRHSWYSRNGGCRRPDRRGQVSCVVGGRETGQGYGSLFSQIEAEQKKALTLVGVAGEIISTRPLIY